MMGFVLVAVAVLSLLSGGRSAPVTSCDHLTQIIEIQGREQLLGRWTYSAESTDITGSQFLTKAFVETSWVKITAANESNTINVLQVQKMFGRCFSLRSTMTLENNTLSMARPWTISEVLLNTGCPDCLVISSKYTLGQSTYHGLQFLSRRNKVTAAETEEFKKQVECLNLPPPVFLDSDKVHPGGMCPPGLCPDDSTSQQKENIDLTSVTTDENFAKMTEKILGSENLMKEMVDVLFSSIAGLTGN